MTLARLAALALAVALAACGGPGGGETGGGPGGGEAGSGPGGEPAGPPPLPYAVRIDQPADGGWVAASFAVRIGVTGEAPTTASPSVSLDGGPPFTGLRFRITSAPEGPHRLEARLGEATAGSSFSVDGTPPELDVPAVALAGDGSVTITVTGRDRRGAADEGYSGTGSMKLSLGQDRERAPVAEGLGGRLVVTLSGFAAGQHTVTALAWDAVGNRATNPATARFTVP